MLTMQPIFIQKQVLQAHAEYSDAVKWIQETKLESTLVSCSLYRIITEYDSMEDISKIQEIVRIY